jgi:23S rRNA (guanosine2251-2'-O)-methyltransferase
MMVMGYHAVEALLEKGYPVKAIHCLQRNDNSRAANLRTLAGKAKTALREYPVKDKTRFESEFKRAGGTPQELESSQGVFAEVSEPPAVSHLDALRAAKEKEPFPIVVYLDSVTDPQNLGSILRSGAFYGISALVLTETRSSPLTPAAIKISSGGFAHVPIVRVPNLARALDEAKEEGFWVIGLSEHATEKFHTARLDSPIALIIGNEESGMRQLTEKSCDYTLSIPGSGALISLNAATAAAVTLTLVRETQRQLKAKG